MSLVGHTHGEAPLDAREESASLQRLLSELLAHNRLPASRLIAARIGLPSGEAAPQALASLGIDGIPVFWESRPHLRVEIFVHLKRRRRLRPLALSSEAP